MPSVPSSVQVGFMNIAAPTTSKIDQVEGNVVSRLGTNPYPVTLASTFNMSGSDFLPKVQTTAQGNVGANDGACGSGYGVYGMRFDQSYMGALQWELGSNGRLGRRPDGSPSMGSFAGL